MTIDTTDKLYQYISKEHMEKMTEKTISNEDWELFVHNVQDTFADEVSELARDFWTTYCPKDFESEEEE